MAKQLLLYLSLWGALGTTWCGEATKTFGTSRRGWFGKTVVSSSTVHSSDFNPPESCETSNDDPAKRTLTRLLSWRGGDAEQQTLDEKVHAAMKKLGLEPPPSAAAETTQQPEQQECEGGACPVAPQPPQNAADDGKEVQQPPPPQQSTGIKEDQVVDAANRLAKSMDVDQSLAMAALSATSTTDDNHEQRWFHEEAARGMIQQELDMIGGIPANSAEVQQLHEQEGFDLFLSRRALAFADGNMDDARAILLADQEDEREEEEQQRLQEQEMQQQQQAASTAEGSPTDIFPTVTVDSKIDPTQLGASEAQSDMAAASSAKQPPMPQPAKKSEVVFEASTAQIQELVLESPVPVLLDVYADWCGPCKVLGPALEEMAVKSGGMFRLVKVNSDNERPVSAALEVTALPTVFGIKDGRIVHMFQGMPKSQEDMQNFMMGLMMGENSFKPPLTGDQKKKYEELTGKLVKMAATASFSFSARERLQDRVESQLVKLVEQVGNDASKAEESANIVRSLLGNIIRNPTETKFRTAKLSNAVLQAKIAPYPAARTILKSVGFSISTDSDGNEIITLGGGKKFVNVAPLTVCRDAIDKWIDKSRYEIAKAARRRKDEEDRARLEAEGAFEVEEEEEEEDADETETLNTAMLKVRMAGKKKVYNLNLAATDRLKNVIDQLPIQLDGDDAPEVQITCVAKKLIVKSTDKATMEETSLEELGLTPSAVLVVDVKEDAGAVTAKEETKGKLAERAISKKRKKGSHTMQSIGIYAKDDNNKAELIDGGGGVWYEHDVSDDEEEGEKGEEEDSTESSSPDEEPEDQADDVDEEES
mmetsp:Transcript_7348/g.18599  ORF Transcript_7348/g.18599 Transcript_7348/m.18599 type:complete len:820 (-) Transcript_7348:88-2547(-)